MRGSTVANAMQTPVSVRSDMLLAPRRRDDLPWQVALCKEALSCACAWALAPARWRAKVPNGRGPVCVCIMYVHVCTVPYRDSRIGEWQRQCRPKGQLCLYGQANNNLVSHEASRTSDAEDAILLTGVQEEGHTCSSTYPESVMHAYSDRLERLN